MRKKNLVSFCFEDIERLFNGGFVFLVIVVVDLSFLPKKANKRNRNLFHQCNRQKKRVLEFFACSIPYEFIGRVRKL